MFMAPAFAEVLVTGRPDRVLHERRRPGAIARKTGDADLLAVAAQDVVHVEENRSRSSGRRARLWELAEV